MSNLIYWLLIISWIIGVFLETACLSCILMCFFLSFSLAVLDFRTYDKVFDPFWFEWEVRGRYLVLFISWCRYPFSPAPVVEEETVSSVHKFFDTLVNQVTLTVWVYCLVLYYIPLVYVYVHTHTHTHTRMYLCMFVCIVPAPCSFF